MPMDKITSGPHFMANFIWLVQPAYGSWMGYPFLDKITIKIT